MPVVTAFSVSEQITNVGAYAGLASILGLAVLSLLYFGQARELRRLRDWAGRAPERTVELQEQADQAAAAAQRRPTPAAVPQAAGTPRAAAAATAAGAVRAVPASQAATAAGAAASVAPPGIPGSVPAPGAPAAPGAAPVPGTPGPAASGDGPVTWAPSPAAAGTPAAGAGQETQSHPALPSDAPLPDAVPSVAAAVPIGPDGPPTDDSPVPLRQVNAVAGTGLPRRRATPEPAAPVGRSNGGERRGGRRVGILAGGAAVLLLVVVLATQVLGGGGSSPSKNAKTDTGNTIVPPAASSTTPTAPAVNPGDVQVYVLNGTTQNGIAADFAKTLETAGYAPAGTGNAAVATETTTTVFYATGKKTAANAVAKQLGVKAANVKAADAAVTANGKGADVIVQIGADKATP